MAKGVRASYDCVAEEYGRRYFHEFDHKPFDREILDRFAERVRGRGPVCDIGCGPGEVACYLRDQGVEDVLGIDISPGMVEQARKLNPGVTFHQGDMLNLEAEDDSWGGIAASKKSSKEIPTKAYRPRPAGPTCWPKNPT